MWDDQAWAARHGVAKGKSITRARRAGAAKARRAAGVGLLA